MSMKSILLGTTIAAAAAMGAQAQILTPQSSYSGEMTVTSDGTAMVMDIFTTPRKQRIEMQTEDGVHVTLIDRDAHTAHVFGKNRKGPMGNRGMKINFAQATSQYMQPPLGQPMPAKIGSGVVAGQVCDLYQFDDTTSCITGDGIMLSAKSADANLEMTKFKRGNQPDRLFVLPSDLQVTDMSALGGMGSIRTAPPSPAQTGVSGGGSSGSTVNDFIANQARRQINSATGLPIGGAILGGNTPAKERQPLTLQSIAEDQAAKQTKKQIKKAAKKQLGSALGGGLLGGVVGGQAGKAAKGVVGGLFGKKKDKKKTDDASQEKKETDGGEE